MSVADVTSLIHLFQGELKTVLKAMKQFTDDEEIDLMMESADKNGDGYLDIKGTQSNANRVYIAC